MRRAASPYRRCGSLRQKKTSGISRSLRRQRQDVYYKIRNTQTIDIFQRNYVYHVAEPLDTDAMRQAAKLLAGTHDFKSFEASGSTPRESTVRTIYRLELLQKEDLLELLERAISTDTVLKERKIELKETTAMLRFSSGDARKLLNILELVVESDTDDTVVNH